MNTVARILNIVARILAGAIGLFLLFVIYRTLPIGAVPISLPISLIFLTLEATLAGLALWFAIAGANRGERAMMGRVLGVGAIVGGVAFALGFVGPIVLTPESNQGPLFGIFVTGPLGLALGCIAAFIWVRLCQRGGRAA
jgi:hypothetical protein